MNKQKLAKNTFFFTAALATQKLLSFVFFIFVAREISVDELGKFSFALSFSAIFAMVLEFGMAQTLIRESARKREEAQKYLSNVLGIKLLGAFFVYLLVILMVNLMGYPGLTKQLVYISGVIMVIDSFTLVFYSVLRGLQNLVFESIGVMANQVIILLVGLLVLKLHLGVMVLISVYLIGSGFNVLYSVILLGVKYGIFPKPKLNKKLIIQIFKLSLPFAVAGFFIRIYSYMDVVLLSKMTNDSAVAIYSVAYKVAFALQFIGVAFSAAIYPAFCSYFISSKEMLAKSFTKSIYYLMLMALPLSVGVITIADKVIGPVFGANYVSAVAPLQILMIALVFIFIYFPVGAMLNAGNKQTLNTVFLGIVSVFNIFANLAFIPFFSYNGSALAALLSYGLLFCLGFPIAGKIAGYDLKYVIISFIKISFSCLLMGLLIMLIKNNLNFLIAIPIGALVYIVTLYLVKGFTKDDLRQMKGLLSKQSDVSQEA